MNYIVDTQCLIWFFEGNPALDSKAKSVIEDPSTNIFMSIAALWEIAIKISIGKLILSQPLEVLIARLSVDDIHILNIDPAHILELLTLTYFHKDPFDRIMIAQAIKEGLTVITSDSVFQNYPVNIL